MFGLSASWLMHRGTVIPSTVVLSHAEQLDRLRVACPPALDKALVAGDPCFDRMRVSQHERERYRAAFGLRPGQRLVVISSTWGPEALLSRGPSAVARIATRLPLDDYRIVLAQHPNISQGHSPWQVRMWLDECSRAGVHLLPPDEGWRAALVAADITIGDHGSVTFYAAALGCPVLLGACPDDAVDPASPVGRLLATAPLLDHHRDPAPQIDAVIAAHDPASYAPITGLTTSVPGESARILRAEMYRVLKLPEPPLPAETAPVPAPEPLPAPPSATLVRAVSRMSTGEAPEISMTRYPARLLHEWPAPENSHLVVADTEPSRRWRELADILVLDSDRTGQLSRQDVERWIGSTLAAMPGCLLAAAPVSAYHWLVGVTDGTMAEIHANGAAAAAGALGASAIHEWLRGGHHIEELPARLRIRIGADALDVRCSVLTDTP